MITKEELKELLHSTETYRVERTTSTNDMDKFQEAICAFSNDLPNSRKNGYLILGAYDNGTLSGLKVTDDLPLRIYEFARHLEITNAGGLYGNARPENFPMINDYRNPLVASAMKTLGYVNMFNRGVRQVQSDLKDNGNKPAVFDVNLLTAFRVNVEAVAAKVAKDVVNGKDSIDLSQVVPSLSQVLSQVVPSLSPACPQLKDSHFSLMSMVMIQLQSQPCSISELMNIIGEKNKNRFRQFVLRPLISIGLVETTIKDIPNSPKQRYALTEKGKELLKPYEV
jgi:ATP-dependent DNA helicase RecG